MTLDYYHNGLELFFGCLKQNQLFYLTSIFTYIWDLAEHALVM